MFCGLLGETQLPGRAAVAKFAPRAQVMALVLFISLPSLVTDVQPSADCLGNRAWIGRAHWV